MDALASRGAYGGRGLAQTQQLSVERAQPLVFALAFAKAGIQQAAGERFRRKRVGNLAGPLEGGELFGSSRPHSLDQRRVFVADGIKKWNWFPVLLDQYLQIQKRG